ncbi:hypothetical protein [Priestia megaterium]|uniref:hypothetical protein n=1 Tax=Priestia megaterium TaxID=1404 RepID=UPI001677A33A|nr:hypothetical protein [Priestia megaterium]
MPPATITFTVTQVQLKKDGTERYPIPFKFGVKHMVMREHHTAIKIITNPNVIVGDTNGALAREVEQYNQMQPDELVDQYIKAHTNKDELSNVICRYRFF